MRVRSSRGGERGASVPQPGTFVRGAEGAKGLPCFPSLPCFPGVETGRRGSFDFCPLLEKDPRRDRSQDVPRGCSQTGRDRRLLSACLLCVPDYSVSFLSLDRSRRDRASNPAQGWQLSGQGRPQAWGSSGRWDRGVSAEPRQNFPSGATM